MNFKYVLREYQKKAIVAIIEKFKANDKTLLRMPTGTGKTVVFAYISYLFLRSSKKVLILQNRRNLVFQTAKAFQNAIGIESNIIMGSDMRLSNTNMTVATVQTLKSKTKRFKLFLKSIDLVIIDECHYGLSNTYCSLYEQLHINAKVLGVTATPKKANQEALAGYFKKTIWHTLFDCIIEINKECVFEERGFICPPKVCRTTDFEFKDIRQYSDSEKKKQYHLVVQDYLSQAKGKQVIVFADSLSDSELLSGLFRDNGIFSVHIGSNYCIGVDGSQQKRIVVFEQISNNKALVICNKDILIAGYDVPNISGVFIVRSVGNMMSYRQMTGRGNRIKDDKKQYLLFDYGGNVKRFGLPNKTVAWSLQDKKRKVIR